MCLRDQHKKTRLMCTNTLSSYEHSVSYTTAVCCSGLPNAFCTNSSGSYKFQSLNIIKLRAHKPSCLVTCHNSNMNQCHNNNTVAIMQIN